MPEMTASQRRRLDRDQEIAADYLADMSPAAIMEKHGVARQTIYNVLSRQNVTLRPVGKRQRTLNTTDEGETGMTYTELLKRAEAAEADAAKLRGLLREAKHYAWQDCSVGGDDLVARIKAALGDDDGN
jgi:predicted DNA-binding protein YlxM (UPF0122 family)